MKQIASKSQATQNASALRLTVRPTNGTVRFDESVTQVGGQTVNSGNTGATTVAQDVHTVAVGDDFPYNPADFGGFEEGGANASQKNCDTCTVLNPISATMCYLC